MSHLCQAIPSANTSPKVPIVLTIAGSDSGGGAGIQADIKAISATGSYACSVITAITAQNTLGVQSIFPIPLPEIEAQLDSVFSDLNIVAVKIGMLASSEIIELVARKLKQYQPKHIVLDPVMVATSGDLLVQPGAITSLIEHLLPIASVITPNIPEALTLVGENPDHFNGDIEALSHALKTLPTQAILLKGGHLQQQDASIDWLITKTQVDAFSSARINTHNTHGTGCTLSSAMASYLAQGSSLVDAAQQAKNYLTQAIRSADALSIGQGHGPVDHFYSLHHSA